MPSDAHELRDLEVDVAATEANPTGPPSAPRPAHRVVLIITSLWTWREEFGVSVETVADRSGLTAEKVDSIEDNAVNTPVPDLAPYAAAVGLRLDVNVVTRNVKPMIPGTLRHDAEVRVGRFAAHVRRAVATTGIGHRLLLRRRAVTAHQLSKAPGQRPSMTSTDAAVCQESSIPR